MTQLTLKHATVFAISAPKISRRNPSVSIIGGGKNLNPQNFSSIGPTTRTIASRHGVSGGAFICS